MSQLLQRLSKLTRRFLAATILTGTVLVVGASMAAGAGGGTDGGGISAGAVLGAAQTGTFTTTVGTVPQRMNRLGRFDMTQCTTGVPAVSTPVTTGPYGNTTHTFNNPFPFPVCHQFTLTMTNPAGCGGSFQPYFAAYAPTFNGAAAYTNLIGYSGVSMTQPFPAAPGGTNENFNPLRFSAVVPPNSDVVVAITDAFAGANGGANCTYSVEARPMLNTIYSVVNNYLATAGEAQTGRLLRNGAVTGTKCNANTASPGITSTTSSFASTGTLMNITSPFPNATCLDFKLTTENNNSTDCGNASPTLAAYSPAYDRANPEANLVGFSGSSTFVGGDASVGFTATIASNAQVFLVVANSIASPTAVPAACRYRVDVSSAQSATPCSPDIDGDGQYTATIDGLIATRAQLGFASSALLTGITPPAGAKRATAAAIRTYLNGSCGMSIAP